MTNNIQVSIKEYAYCENGVEIRRVAEHQGFRHLGYRVHATKDGQTLYLSRLSSDINSSALFAKACMKYHCVTTNEW